MQPFWRSHSSVERSQTANESASFTTSRRPMRWTPSSWVEWETLLLIYPMQMWSSRLVLTSQPEGKKLRDWAASWDPNNPLINKLIPTPLTSMRSSIRWFQRIRKKCTTQTKDNSIWLIRATLSRLFKSCPTSTTLKKGPKKSNSWPPREKKSTSWHKYCKMMKRSSKEKKETKSSS